MNPINPVSINPNQANQGPPLNRRTFLQTTAAATAAIPTASLFAQNQQVNTDQVFPNGDQRAILRSKSALSKTLSDPELVNELTKVQQDGKSYIKLSEANIRKIATKLKELGLNINHAVCADKSKTTDYLLYLVDTNNGRVVRLRPLGMDAKDKQAFDAYAPEHAVAKVSKDGGQTKLSWDNVNGGDVPLRDPKNLKDFVNNTPELKGKDVKRVVIHSPEVVKNETIIGDDIQAVEHILTRTNKDGPQTISPNAKKEIEVIEDLKNGIFVVYYKKDTNEDGSYKTEAIDREQFKLTAPRRDRPLSDKGIVQVDYDDGKGPRDVVDSDIVKAPSNQALYLSL